MKSLKILISLFLLTLCFPIVDVSAIENDGYVGKYVYSEEERQNARERALEIAKEESKANMPQTRMDETVENWVRGGTAISNESPRREVLNQLKGGYKYGSGGGGMYWGESSATTGTVSVGVSIGGKYGSFSVAYAPGTKTTSSGQYKNCPQSLWYVYVKLYTTRHYEVTSYAVYRKSKYDSGQGTYVRTEYISVPYSVAWYYQAV